MNFVPRNFVVDSDGVFTDGKFYYDISGKVMKIFGPDDHDALTFLRDRLHIHVVSGDKRGFPITQKRIAEDMKLSLDLVSTFERVEWMEKRFNLAETIYMGDGIFDTLVFENVGYSIAPANGFYKTRAIADFVTESRGGEGAVAEACLHILEELLHVPFDTKLIKSATTSSMWTRKK